MPEICRFYGIVVAMYYGEHLPPHFHARYGNHKVMISIGTLEPIGGFFPPRAAALLTEWAILHREELRTEWELARERKALFPIAPLE